MFNWTRNTGEITECAMSNSFCDQGMLTGDIQIERIYIPILGKWVDMRKPLDPEIQREELNEYLKELA